MTTTTVSEKEKQEKNYDSRLDYIGEILFQIDDAKNKASFGLVDDVNYGLENVRHLAKQRNLGIEEDYFDGIVKEAYSNWGKNTIIIAKRYADEGLVSDVQMNLMAVAKASEFFQTKFNEQQMKDIMRTAYKAGIKREISESRKHAQAGDIPLAVQCLDYADYYSDEMLGCQRALRDIKPSFLDKLLYRRRYGNASQDDVQKVFDATGRKYDEEAWWDSRRSKRDIYNERINIFKSVIKPKINKPKREYKWPSFNYKAPTYKMPSIFKPKPAKQKAAEPKAKTYVAPAKTKPRNVSIGKKFKNYISNSTMYKILSS